MTATIESSWILIWLPTKKRENSQRKSSSISNTRRITRLLSVDEEQQQNSSNISNPDKNKNPICARIGEDEKICRNPDVLSKEGDKDANEEKWALIKDSNVLNADPREAVKVPCNGVPELAAVGSRASTASNRFQIQRQLTKVLSTQEEDEEEEQVGSKETTEDDIDDSEETVFEEAESYEERITKLLVDELDIRATSLKTKDGGHILVTFCLETHRVEDVLLKLQENGIGNSPSDTSISVIPSSVHFEVPLVDVSDPR